MWLVMWCYVGVSACDVGEARAAGWRPPTDWATLSTPWAPLESQRPLTLDAVERITDGARFATQDQCMQALRRALPVRTINFRREPRGAEPGYRHCRRVVHHPDFVEGAEWFTTIPGLGPSDDILIACFEEHEGAPVG